MPWITLLTMSDGEFEILDIEKIQNQTLLYSVSSMFLLTLNSFMS